MNEEKTQIADRVASALNAELDKRLYYVESVVLRHKKTGDIKLCRVFSWRDDDGSLHHDYFSHNQQPTKIKKSLVTRGYSLPLNKQGLLMTDRQLKKEMFSCAIGLVV